MEEAEKLFEEVIAAYRRQGTDYNPALGAILTDLGLLHLAAGDSLAAAFQPLADWKTQTDHLNMNVDEWNRLIDGFNVEALADQSRPAPRRRAGRTRGVRSA